MTAAKTPPAPSKASLSPARVAALCDRLWSGRADPLFAVLDGARDPSVVPSLRGLPRWCLFSGNLAPELAAAAPYLAALDRHSEETRSLLARAWGKSWGVLLAAPTDPETLRRHLRRFLRVQDPRGKTVYFRYYDPRVLRVYLPTCDVDELRVFFGPVARFIIEDKGSSSYSEHRRAGPDLFTEHVAWDPEG
ncbi:MAG: DUF4123 domain-containing protein [Polyangiaceae bacterium]